MTRVSAIVPTGTAARAPAISSYRYSASTRFTTQIATANSIRLRTGVSVARRRARKARIRVSIGPSRKPSNPALHTSLIGESSISGAVT